MQKYVMTHDGREFIWFGTMRADRAVDGCSPLAGCAGFLIQHLLSVQPLEEKTTRGPVGAKSGSELSP